MKTTVHHQINKTITERENQAVVEYNILKHLYPKFQKVEKCSVPRPLLVLPEVETYLTDFVTGDLLLDMHHYSRWFSSRYHFNALQEYYFYCGKWLKHFQEFTGVKKAGSEALCGVLERCDHRLRLIEESGDPRCPRDFRDRVMDFIHEQMSRLTGETILVSGRHGDFGPWNVIAGSHGITVIDFLGYQEEPLPVDLLKILVCLEDEKISLTGSRKRVDTLRKSFLDGYGYEMFPDTPLPVLLICEVMQRVVSIWGSISNQTRQFHHRMEANMRLKMHIRWLTNKGIRRLG